MVKISDIVMVGKYFKVDVFYDINGKARFEVSFENEADLYSGDESQIKDILRSMADELTEFTYYPAAMVIDTFDQQRKQKEEKADGVQLPTAP